MMAIEAGKLRHRVTLQSVAHVTNSAGETSADFADVAEVWARVETLRGWQVEQAKAAGTNTTHRVTIRYYPGVASTWRLMFEGKALDIVSIDNPEERNEMLIISCEQQGGQTA